MSLGKWAVEFGLITKLEYDLLRSRHSSKLRQKHIDMAIKSGIIEGASIIRRPNEAIR